MRRPRTSADRLASAERSYLRASGWTRLTRDEAIALGWADGEAWRSPREGEDGGPWDRDGAVRAQKTTDKEQR